MFGKNKSLKDKSGPIHSTERFKKLKRSEIEKQYTTIYFRFKTPKSDLQVEAKQKHIIDKAQKRKGENSCRCLRFTHNQKDHLKQIIKII